MTTYIYVKQHRNTKLKYFGMTRKKNPYDYMGSGTYWLRHLKIHGKYVDTLNVWEFDDDTIAETFALNFSKENDIVESNEWANLRPENVRTGQVFGASGMKGSKNPRFGKTKELNAFYGQKHTEETIKLYKKQKSGSNNPRAIPVITPYGIFGCMKDA